jgi:NADH-quinone oxidoreductase subunit J
MALFGALMVVTSKNPVYSVLWLILTFFAISGHYILLNAQFLAVVNIIVYAGAIMVLFLFVIMLMNLNKNSEPQKNRWVKIIGAIAGGCLLLVLVAALRNTEMKGQIAQVNEGNIGLIRNLGKELFTTYVVPFEISSILFLSAMVGAVVIGKKE